jgi:hypothetical protein
LRAGAGGLNLFIAGWLCADGFPQRNFKEIVMNETPQLELVDLGDAKEQTKGELNKPVPEDNHVGQFRDI